jgi:hypothetical protein
MQRLSVVTFALLAACELQPTPKRQAPPPTPTPAPVAEAPADAAVVVDGPAAPAFTDQCRDVGVHIADVIISSATDPGAKSIYEQDRAKIVRSTAETCTTQTWTDAAAKCYLKANTTAELKACETKFTPPQPRDRPEGTEPQTRAGSGAGSGSATAPRAGAGSAAAPRAGAGSAATPRAGAGSAAPRAGAGSAAAPRAGAGSAAAPRPAAGAGSGSALRR